jgi:hypothetical protein
MDMVGDAAIEPFERYIESKPRFDVPDAMPRKRRQLIAA